jgi:plastocyanin
MQKPNLGRRLFCTVLICGGLCYAQNVSLTGRVAFISANKEKESKTRDAEKVVLWLTPVAGAAPASTPPTVLHPRLTQRNKSFDPHVLIVPVGSVVEFPNRDPFFHNVFSLFEGKRFDLGLYEAGSTREVRFDKPGISYIFCNIHAQMSAVVIALDTSYYTVSNQHGEVVIPDVPAGRYLLHVWYEAAPPESLKTLTREITVSEDLSTLGVLRLTEVNLPRTHKNKYDREYEPSAPIDSPGYQQP